MLLISSRVESLEQGQLSKGLDNLDKSTDGEFYLINYVATSATKQ